MNFQCSIFERLAAVLPPIFPAGIRGEPAAFRGEGEGPTGRAHKRAALALTREVLDQNERALFRGPAQGE